MCVLFWKLDNSAIKYKFIFAANRDEFLNRPTSLASWWNPNILSGLDLFRPVHGTWLGINRTGRFAAVTNYREPQTVDSELLLSRGAIIRSILESNYPLEQCLNTIKSESHMYGGFNLISADLNDKHSKMGYLSNRGFNEIKHLKSGEIYGLSNSLLDDPWPKVKIGTNELKSICEKEHTTHPCESSNVKMTIRIPKFDNNGAYGTRTSTAILVDHDDNVVFVEKTWFDEDENIIEDDERYRWFRFKIGKMDNTV
ncbi:22852_t:CDS:2 [Cetraspora pellucida]|uniref:22852_t:CDS:1 n=1 Tax=Cetraspora pellucida TaxID=1433469 RepID=A0A9N8ZII2_9GLOM|nr:22852_t:CDS:2 [Cetraspora pellucida]